MSDQQPKPAETTTTTEAPPAPQVTADFLEQVIARTVQAVEARPQRVSPFDLTTFDDIVRFAEHTANSGLCPKDFKGKPDDIISAVLWGKELGLPAMACLNSMAVINGRPSLWGDAVPGLCLRTGQVQDVVERFEGEPGSDDFTAVCIVTRRGQTPREGRFSLADVRQAGLKSVHLQYPKDMMMWRARHRAWHGAFPDTLKGLGTAELEAEAANTPTWDMPRPAQAWFVRSKRSDGSDATWLNATVEKLLAEQNAWKWMELLLEALATAPTLRDVDDLDNLPMCQEVIGNAPKEAREQIENAFGDARKRTQTPPAPATEAAPANDKAPPPAPAKATRRRAAPPAEQPPPAETAPQPPETPAEPTFDYYLLDETGDPIGETPYTGPVAWARAYAAHYERSSSREAMREHNADAIADARQMDLKADDILAALEEAEADPLPPGIQVIEPGTDRSGHKDWRQWLTDLKAAVAGTERWQLMEWIEAHRAVIDSAPQSARLLAIKTVVTRCKELDVPLPAGFTANGNGHASGPSAAERDQKIADTILETLDTLNDEHAVRAYQQMTTVTAPLGRWQSERPELATTIHSAFAGRIELIKAERGGG